MSAVPQPSQSYGHLLVDLPKVLSYSSQKVAVLSEKENILGIT